MKYLGHLPADGGTVRGTGGGKRTGALWRRGSPVLARVHLAPRARLVFLFAGFRGPVRPSLRLSTPSSTSRHLTITGGPACHRTGCGFSGVDTVRRSRTTEPCLPDCRMPALGQADPFRRRLKWSRRPQARAPRRFQRALRRHGRAHQQHRCREHQRSETVRSRGWNGTKKVAGRNVWRPPKEHV